ncbi:DNA-directed RNA polymerase subunit beta [Shouchella sp. JSM 1781072]|uniref:DNA-directed RNA polymerase subunit beta n=1 Tax=Bacillaceae TaxID=186817 RepID=UPI000C075E8E|nr:DNA-directed RNA polymerase subunit beta [Bacillus sp. Marseille-P3800]
MSKESSDASEKESEEASSNTDDVKETDEKSSEMPNEDTMNQDSSHPDKQDSADEQQLEGAVVTGAGIHSMKAGSAGASDEVSLDEGDVQSEELLLSTDTNASNEEQLAETEEQHESEEATASEEKMTREERKRRQEEEHGNHEPYKRERIRLVPIWLRIIIVTVLAGAALVLGLIIGFSVIGGQDNTWEVLTPDLWYNIIDTIRGQ